MKLYKYLDPKRAPLLESCCIRFTQAAEFNDPFELSPPLEAIFPPARVKEALAELLPETWKEDALGSVANDPEIIQLRRLLERSGEQEIWNTIESGVIDALSAFERDPATHIADWLPVARQYLPMFRARLNIQFAMLCLAQDPDCLLMWAHYADCHRGVVLEFDASHPFFDQRETSSEAVRYLRPVTYSDQRPGFTVFDPALDLAEALDHIAAAFFLTKASKWSYEREWRMIVPVTQENPKADAIHLFLLPPDCLTAVIFGIRTPQVEKDRLVSVLQEKGWFQSIELRQAVQDESEYRIRIEPYVLPRADDAALPNGESDGA